MDCVFQQTFEIKLSIGGLTVTQRGQRRGSKLFKKPIILRLEKKFYFSNYIPTGLLCSM